MPPSETSTGSLNRSVIACRWRVVHAAGLRVGGEQRRVRGRGRRERRRRARRRARRARARRRITSGEPRRGTRAARAGSGATPRPARRSRATCCASPSAAVLPDATSSNDDPTRHATSAATTGSSPGMRDGFHAAKRNPTPSATSNEPMWRAVCTGRPASDAEASARGSRPRSARARWRRGSSAARGCVSGSASARRCSAPMAARMPGVRSGMAGAGDEPQPAVEAPRRRARSRGSRRSPARWRVDAWPRRDRGPRRRAGPRSRGGSACRSYEVVAAEDRRSSPSIVGRSGRADAAVPRRTRRRPHRAAPRGPGQPGRRLAPRLPPRGPRRRRRRHPGHVRPGVAGAAGVPGRLERPHLAARRSPAGPAPTRCGARCAGDGSPTGPSGRPRRGAGGGTTADPGGAHAVAALVDELPDDQRAAFVLTQVVGCSYAEAAEACGVPVGTIRSRVARAREHLVETLRAAGDRMTRRARAGCARSRVVGALVGGAPGRDRGARRARTASAV